jgi:hypothetical protein
VRGQGWAIASTRPGREIVGGKKGSPVESLNKQKINKYTKKLIYFALYKHAPQINKCSKLTNKPTNICI